jgi:hypothetical protein
VTQPSPPLADLPPADVLVHSLQKADGNKFVLLYLAGDEERAIRAVNRWLRDPTINFNHADAYKLIRKIKEESDGSCYS